MTAMRLNRFSLSEIENVTIHCKKCGAGHFVKMDSARFDLNKCPSCGEPYGALAANVFALLQSSYKELQAAGDSFDIEFDIVE